MSHARILYLTPGCFDKGGISRYSRYQIDALRRIHGKNQIRVLSLLGPDEDKLEVPFAVDWHGSSKRKQASLVDKLEFAARVFAISAQWRPDVIHTAHVNFGSLVNTASLLSAAKTVLNVYGLEIWSGLNRSRRQHMRRMNHIVSDCNFTARYVVENGLHDVYPSVIWDPVDLDRFCPGATDAAVLEKYDIPDPTRYTIVLSLGRLAKEAAHKGFDRLIKAVAEATCEAPMLRLVIAGSGDDRSRLEAIAKNCGIRDKVVFTGSVDEADLPNIYRCAHIFSLVSDRGHGRGEGIPLTPLEAMACGVPIIVSNDDGSQEAVFEHRNGFVVSPHDPQAHVNALLTLIQEAPLRRGMAIEARKVAVQHFGFLEFVHKHEALSHKLS